MARLYANENLPFQVVEKLRRLGYDVLTTYESGQAGQATPDEDVLAFAVAEGRILVTLNRKHFVRLHREQPDCTRSPTSNGRSACAYQSPWVGVRGMQMGVCWPKLTERTLAGLEMLCRLSLAW